MCVSGASTVVVRITGCFSQNPLHVSPFMLCNNGKQLITFYKQPKLYTCLLAFSLWSSKLERERSEEEKYVTLFSSTHTTSKVIHEAEGIYIFIWKFIVMINNFKKKHSVECHVLSLCMYIVCLLYKAIKLPK